MRDPGAWPRPAAQSGDGQREQDGVAARMAVPFLDLRRQHADIGEDILSELGEIIASGAFTNGPQVAAFERSFSEYCRSRFAVGVGSGLDALRLGLLALGIDRGDEVIVPANTFVATWEAIVQAGGVPVPVDVTIRDYNLDPAAVEAAAGPRTRAIVPVHLYGQLADMAAIRRIAEQNDLRVLEDAAQAHGAERDGFRAGSCGSAAGFSFYPGKNLGAFGDAGAVVTDDAQIAERLRMLREHGQREKYRHDVVGYTSRLDTFQAAVLLRKLALLDRWNDERRVIAAQYREELDGVGDIVLPPVAEGSVPVWHLFVVRTEKREALSEHLRGLGISTGLHYPQPPHLSDAFAYLGYARGEFPLTEALADELLSLPLFPGMTNEQVVAVVSGIRAAYQHG